jgi:uncharacterized protein (TIGR03437 family)
MNAKDSIPMKRMCMMAILAVTIWALPAAAVDLVVSPASLAFVATPSVNPAPQVVSVSSSAPSVGVSPSLSSTVPWIALSGANAGSVATVTNVYVAVNAQGFAPGFYNGQVTITQSGFNKSPQVIAVNLQVFPAGISYVVSPPVLEVSAAPGANASSQFFSITTLGSATVKPTLTMTTSSGGNWLALSSPVTSTLSTQSTVRVDFNTTGLATGFYSAVITATGAGVQNSPVTIPVNLAVGTATTGPALAVSPASLSFTASTGANPLPTTIAINNSGQGTIFPVLTTSTTDGNAWLNASLNGQIGAGGSTTATVSISTGSLANGSYSGTILLTDAGAINAPVKINVALSIQVANPLLSLGSGGLTFNSASGSVQKLGATVPLSNAGTGTLNFNASASTKAGGNWLAVTPATGSANNTLTVTVDPTNLPVGVYTGAITVSIIGTQASQNIQVLFAVGTPVASINQSGIVNGANFVSTIVAPGEIVSIFGLNLGPATGQQTQATAGFLATTQAGISVTFDGTPAPLYYVGANQINLQVPWEVAGKTSTTVLVANNGQNSLPYTLSLRPLDPAMFVAGNGRVTVVDQAGNQITPSNPASAGQQLSIYATGLGSVNGTIKTGQLTPAGTLFSTTAPASVTAGANASVSFCGLAPGFVGLYQINFTLPASLTAGDQPLVLGIGNLTSPTLPLAVR